MVGNLYYYLLINVLRTYVPGFETLWNRAKWVGTAFLWDETDSASPILALLFRDMEAARQIFRNWRTEIGQHDRDEALRVTIVRHVNKAVPYSYRVIIGINPAVAFAGAETKRAIMISRINTMMPTSDYNLSRFLKCHTQFGSYFLAYAVLEDGQAQPVAMLESCISKHKIFVRDAWEIGRNNPDCVAIQEGDDPIIPPGQDHAPVVELMRWRREGKSGDRE